MAKGKGSWSNGMAPAQGAADSPHFGQDILGKGFGYGVHITGLLDSASAPNSGSASGAVKPHCG